MKKEKRQRSEAEKSEDQAMLLRELKRRRAEVEEKLNSEKKLEEKLSGKVKKIGKELAEGSITEKRLQSQKRFYDEFVRLLPSLRESVAKAKLEFETCSSLIDEMESASSIAETSTPRTSCDAAA